MDENNVNTLNIGIVGLGLIGGSFCRAFTKFTRHKVFGRGRILGGGAASVAKETGAIFGELTDEKLPELDLIMFAVNPRTAVEIMPKYLPFLRPGCIVTDAGGVKRGVSPRWSGRRKNTPRCDLSERTRWPAGSFRAFTLPTPNCLWALPACWFR